MLRITIFALLGFLASAPALATDTDPETAEDLVVVGGVELCGPVEPAVEYLKPTDEKWLKKWEKKRDRFETMREDGCKEWRFPHSSVVVPGLGGKAETSHSAKLVGCNGKVRSVSLRWGRDTMWGTDRDIFVALERKLTFVKGDPDTAVGTMEDIQFKRESSLARRWIEGKKQTRLWWGNFAGPHGGAILTFECTELAPDVGGDFF